MAIAAPARPATSKAPQLPPYNHQPRPYQGPSAEEVLKLRKEHLTPSLFHYYRKPLMIVEGSMQYLYDEKGRRYLDAFGGIVTVSVGHCHPEVLAAVDEQNHRLQHVSTIYLHPGIAQYGKELADCMPGDLKVCYFVNSGSEANELALMLARAYTGNYDIIALRNSYHGGTSNTMGITSHHTWKYNIPHSFGVQFARAPYPYRGAWPATDPHAGKNYAADVEELIRFASPGKIAGFIAESIQGGNVNYAFSVRSKSALAPRSESSFATTSCGPALSFADTARSCWSWCASRSNAAWRVPSATPGANTSRRTSRAASLPLGRAPAASPLIAPSCCSERLRGLVRTDIGSFGGAVHAPRPTATAHAHADAALHAQPRTRTMVSPTRRRGGSDRRCRAAPRLPSGSGRPPRGGARRPRGGTRRRCGRDHP